MLEILDFSCKLRSYLNVFVSEVLFAIFCGENFAEDPYSSVCHLRLLSFWAAPILPGLLAQKGPRMQCCCTNFTEHHEVVEQKNL